MRDKKFMDEDKDFGARLREERERLGIKDFDMSHMCGRPYLNQKKYEAGTATIPIDYLHALAQHSDVDVLYVLTGDRSWLSQQPTSDGLKLLEHYLAMSAEHQFELERVAAALADQLADEPR